MKLLSIRFKNIHSLKGEHEVRFDEEPLRSSGIFAITGATGSGKSSLLDVITLALYNEIPRFDRKISKNEIDKMGSVVTHFTKESWAEVTYQTKNGKYRSRWEISKAQTGSWRDYNMSIIDLSTQQAINAKKSEVPSKNEKLIGLNYEQFVKSILLSQGEFSRFLKSKKHERSKLLEDITGTHIYREIGITAFELLKQKKQELDKQQAVLDSINFLTKEEKKELRTLQNKYNRELKKNKKSEKSVMLQLNAKRLQIEVEDEVKNMAQAMEALILRQKNIETEKQLYAIHRSLISHAPDMQSYQEALQELSHETEHVTLHEKEITTHNVTLASSIKEMSLFTSRDISESSFMDEMANFEKKINKYDEILRDLQRQGYDCRQRISGQLKKGSTTLESHLTPKAIPSEVVNIIHRRLKKLGSNKVINLSDYNKEKDNTQREYQVLKDWENTVTQHAKIAHTIADISVKVNKLKSDHKESTSKRIQLKVSDEKMNQQLFMAEKKNKVALEKATLIDLQQNLTKGEPCPICGSIEHPYAHHEELIDVGMAGIQLEKVKMEKKEIERELLEEEKNIAVLESSLASTIKNLKIYEEEIILLGKKSKLLINQNTFLSKINQSKIQEEQQIRLDKINEATKQLQSHEEILLLQSIISEYKSLEEILKKYIKINSERQNEYNGEDVNRDANIIQNKYRGAQSGIERERALLAKSKKRIVDLNTRTNKLKKSILQNIKSVGFSDIDKAQDSLLSANDAERISNELTNITKIESTIITKKEDISKKKETLSKLEIPKASMADINNILLKLNEDIQMINQELGSLSEQIKQDDIRIKKHASLKSAIDALHRANRVYELMNTYIGDKTGNKFSNYAQELTLSRLLALANARLKEMNDRYILQHELDGDDLLIIDQYQGNAKRAVKTLSGGESFIISLALALSLSDLASRNVRLESLFIDEGFGTLDPETLDMALSTLEKLQNDSGKTIGIISHVASLKERIQTQIKVNKNAQGYSELEVVGY